MRESIYMTKYFDAMQKHSDSPVDIAFDKVDHEYKLPHSDIDRALYMLKRCPMNLGNSDKALLTEFCLNNVTTADFRMLCENNGIRTTPEEE